MRTTIARAMTAVLVSCGSFIAFAVDSGPGRAEQAFSNGGRVSMELGGGDYEIRSGAGDKIVVTYSTETAEQMKSVEVQFVGGHDSTKLKVHGPHNNFHATIEVPPRTDLYVRLAAGDLRVRDIEGNKDIESHAGDMNIQIGKADDYGQVDASVNAGDLSAPAFHTSQDGLFRSFHQQGKGKYRLHVHLGAGDLNLR